MKEIPIQIKDKIAVVRTALPIVCGNSDYIAVFTFIGDDWSAYPTKTARFVYGNEHIDVVFTGDRCDIPPIPDAPCVEIGVYAGDIKTSTPAYVRCLRSITSGNGSPADPPESVYNQLMEQLKDLGELSDEELAAAIEAYFAENPVEVPVTSVNGMTGAVTLVADNVGALNGKAVTYWSGVKNNDLFSILTIHSCGIVRNRTLDAPDGMAFPVFVICGNLSSGIREFSVIDNEGKCYSCEASLSSSEITKCKLVVNMAEYAKTADIPDWALADTKPTYTAAEVGAAGKVYTITSATNESIYNAVVDMYTNKIPHINVETTSGDNLVLYSPQNYKGFAGDYRYTGLAINSEDGAIYKYVSIFETTSSPGYQHKLTLTKLTDIVDNLTSDDTDKPLSAAQGKALKEMVDELDTGGSGVTDDHINELIDAKLGVIENGSY